MRRLRGDFGKVMLWLCATSVLSGASSFTMGSSVSKNDIGAFVYTYSIANQAFASIWMVTVRMAAGTVVSNIVSPAGWRSQVQDDSASTTIVWFTEGDAGAANGDLGAYVIAPGSAPRQFGFSSPMGPEPGVAFAVGADFNTDFIEPLVASPAPSINPVITPGGVVDAASFRNNSLTPGGLTTIFGTGLSKGSTAADAVPLPLNLKGVGVSVNGVVAPLLYVSDSQINFQVPWEVPPQALGDVVVTSNGISSKVPR